MNTSPFATIGTHTITKDKPLCPICMTGAKTQQNSRFTSSLGPLIRLNGYGNKLSFALLFCAHTSNELKGKTFSFTRLHKVDRLTARKFYSFSETEFNDLAVANTILPESFCISNLVKAKIKAITSANIGDEVRIISVNRSSANGTHKIKAVEDHSSRTENNRHFQDLIQLDCKGIPGDSGSPVLSLENEVIGLIVRSDENGYSYCNKLYEAKPLLLKIYNKFMVKADLEGIYLITQ